MHYDVIMLNGNTKITRYLTFANSFQLAFTWDISFNMGYKLAWVHLR